MIRKGDRTATWGMRDEAIAWLERGYNQRDPKMVFLKAETKWNNLHGRFTIRRAVAPHRTHLLTRGRLGTASVVSLGKQSLVSRHFGIVRDV